MDTSEMNDILMIIKKVEYDIQTLKKLIGIWFDSANHKAVQEQTLSIFLEDIIQKISVCAKKLEHKPNKWEELL